MSIKEVHTLQEINAELQKQVTDIGAAFIPAATKAMDNAMIFLQEQVPEYPDPPQQGGWLKQGTAKSRRFFFWAVKQGKIDGWQWVDDDKGGHPEGRYKRKNSAGIGGSITYEVTNEHGKVVGVIGTNKDYAPWVIGPKYPGEMINGRMMWQARIHEGRWWILPEVMENNVAGAWERFDEAFFMELAKLFTGAK